MSNFSTFFPVPGGGGGGGLTNEIRILSSAFFYPADPYGDGTRAITAGAIVHFTMIGGGQGGQSGSTNSPYNQKGGTGGRCWSSTVTLADATTPISIGVGGGGTTSLALGGNSTAIQSGGISISTDTSDIYSTPGGNPSLGSGSSPIYGITTPTYGLAPFSQGGVAITLYLYGMSAGYNAAQSNYAYEANTGQGGWAQYGTTPLIQQNGQTGIVIINW